MRKWGWVIGLVLFTTQWGYAHGGVDTSEGMLNSTLHDVIPIQPLARWQWELRLLGGVHGSGRR